MHFLFLHFKNIIVRCHELTFDEQVVACLCRLNNHKLSEVDRSVKMIALTTSATPVTSHLLQSWVNLYAGCFVAITGFSARM